jgi:hypothetical protein
MSLTNSDVVMRWAHHNEDGRYKTSGRSKSLSYNGPVLYSYNTPIARYYKDFVLVTTHKYGVTTAHHITIGARMTAYPTFYVPNLDDRHDDNADHLHGVLLDEVSRMIRYFKNRSEHMDDGVPHYMYDGIKNNHATVMDYVKRTKAKLHLEVPPLDDLLAFVTDERNKRWGKYMDPKEVAKRERAKARNMAKLALLGEL